MVSGGVAGDLAEKSGELLKFSQSACGNFPAVRDSRGAVFAGSAVIL